MELIVFFVWAAIAMQVAVDNGTFEKKSEPVKASTCQDTKERSTSVEWDEVRRYRQECKVKRIK